MVKVLGKKIRLKTDLELKTLVELDPTSGLAYQEHTRVIPQP